MKARHGRQSAGVGYASEPFERRILLSTFPINGTAGPDTWQVEADAGVVTVNGVTTTDASITDILVSGLDGNDTLFVLHSTIPIVFNGGNNDDAIYSGNGLMTDQIHSTLTFNGGAGTDLASLENVTMATPNSYSFFATSITWGTGNLAYDAAVENLTLNDGSGNSTTMVTPLSSVVNVTINGFGGSDTAMVNITGPATAGTVSFAAGGGAGTDSLSINDNSGSGQTYTVGTASIVRGSRTINFDSDAESVQLQGTPGSNTFNVSGGFGNSWLGTLALIGGSSSDAFNLTAAQVANMTVDGGSGPIDSLVIDDRTHPMVIPRADADVSTFTRYFGAVPNPAQVYNLGFTGMEAWTYFGANITNAINVYGTPSSLLSSQQATVICGANADIVTVHPHDANGNLTINGNLGIGGGLGTDRVIIEDTGATNGIAYFLTNTFNASTQNINGLGTRGFGAGNDVETMEIRAGNGNDTFTVNSWLSTEALVINSGDGFDTFEVSPTAKSVSAAIVSGASMSYDGGHYDGTGTRAGSTYDFFNIYNQNNTSVWTITYTSTAVTYAASGYSVTLNFTNIGGMTAYGGTQGDAFTVRSSTAQLTDNALDGAGGNDSYTFGFNGLTGSIRSAFTCEGFSGTDSVIVDDHLDTTGRGTHIVEWLNGSIINNDPSDTLFPSGADHSFGTIFANQIAGNITILLGTGSDTVSFAPVVTGTYSIQGNTPTTAPGDRLMLGFALQTGQNFTPGVTGAGSYTFTNRKPFSYTGIETKTIDSVAPAVLAQSFSPATSGMDYQFSEDVSGGLYYTNFNLKNLTTNQNVAYEVQAYSYDGGTNTLHYTFPGLPGGVLPGGSYRATLTEATDQSGNYMVGTVTYNFIWSPGTSGPDAFRIALNAAATMNDVYVNNEVTPAFSADYSTLNLIALVGGDAADTFVVDTSNGNPFAASGIVLDGGNAVDSVRVSVTDLVDTVAFQAGAVIIDGGQVAHSGVEQFAYTGTMEHFVTLSVDAGSVTADGTDRFENLSIADGAAVIVAPGNSTAVVARGLSVTGTGLLDLTDNAVIVTNSTVAAVRSLLAAGYNGGSWNGATGIVSTAAAASAETSVGFAGNASLNLTEFKGVTGLDGNDVLVKYTYAGDANLDGKVDIGDLGLLSGAWQQTSGKTWFDGDFTFDGKVDIGDLGLLSGNWQKGVGNPL